MRSLKDYSINTKLNLLVTVAGGAAMLFACAAFAVNDYRMIRADKIRQVATVADLLSRSATDALIDGHAEKAAKVLRSLDGQRPIRHAFLYDSRGNVLAAYHADGSAKITPPVGPPGSRFLDDGSLDVTRPIIQGGQLVGTIRLRAATDGMQAKMMRCAKIVGLVIVLSLGASFLLSRRLQHAISAPIRQLAKTVHRISIEHDYSIRVGKSDDSELGFLYDQFNGMLDRVQQAETQLQFAHDELETHVQQRTRQLSQANLELSREVIERNRAEKELDTIHKRLLEAARQAGMAEVATGVLHNVGNVLNSVNVSATLVADRMRHSRIGDLSRAVEMMNDHTDDLAEFLAEDERGKLLPGFFRMMSEHLHQENEAVLSESQSLLKNIDHIKTIVAMQQSYAGVAGVVEAVSLPDLIEDALKLNVSSLEKYGIEIVRDFAELPEMRVEKQRLLQVLVNLIANAKDSLVESDTEHRQLTIRTCEPVGNWIRIEVTDNGLGIPADDLTRIFSHGFTTKQQGHGFGLHASANSAKEMGGGLTAFSEGPRRGATFTVELPFLPIEFRKSIVAV